MLRITMIDLILARTAAVTLLHDRILVPTSLFLLLLL